MKVLVILVCGDMSVHPLWGLEDKTYDLWIHYYGDTQGKYKEHADYYQEGKGFKWPIIHGLYESRKNILTEYDYIICPDDDIIWKPGDFVKAANLMKEYNITLGCPSVSDKGTCYAALHTRIGQIGRLVDFVEILSPIFTKEAFEKVSWTFKESNSGWGIDSIWAWEFSEYRMGVFDEISVQHCRQQFKGEIYPALTAQRISPQIEAQRIHDLYPFAGCNSLGPLKGITD